jgi:hypothetical protein
MPERFISLIVTMLPAFREMEQRLDREIGRQFNAFKLFDMNENATSRILAFLLDPKEAHGQNDVFLRLFIERFVPAWQGTFDYTKAHMASTTEPVDVTICDGSHWLGIENKIFGAQEQNRQAERYLNSLRAAPSQKDYRLIYLIIYLSPRGAGPGDYSLPAEGRRVHGAHLVCGAWAQAEEDGDQMANIADWLVDCRNQCRAENLTWFIRQFAAYVDSVNAVQKETDMIDTAIIGLALKDQQNLEAALRISKSTNEIRRKVLSTFLKHVQTGLQEWVRKQDKDWEVVAKWPGGNWIEQPDKKWLPLLLRKKAWPALVGVAIQAEYDGPWEVFIGILGPTQDTWRSDDGTKYFGEQNQFIGLDSRQRIARVIGPEGKDYWVDRDLPLRDAAGQDISDWRDTTTVTRLYSDSEKEAVAITGRMTGLAEKISSLVIDAT